MPKVSIIIPVHNTARYVDATLDSIFSQTLQDYEILLIDDGSTDGSGAIIDNYAATYENIKAFHKPCGGVSSARNVGLENMSPDSRYVMFIDSDDMITPGALEKLVAAMGSSPDATMALGAIGLFTRRNSMGTILDSKIPCPRAKKATIEYLDDFLHAKVTLSQKYLCNRTMRADIIRENHLRFDESIHYKEDGLFVIRYLLSSTGPVVCLNELVYLYRQNPTSAMGSLNNKSGSWSPRILTNLDAHGRILDELRAHRVSRRLILQEIHNTFSCRRWILRRVIGHRPGRQKASLTTLLKISRPVLTALF